MTTPQDSPKRKKQKARRTKQLAAWREKQATAEASGQKKPEPKAKAGAAKKKAAAK